MGGNSKEPISQFGLFPECVEAFQGAHKSILHDIFGILDVAAHSKTKIVQALLISFHNLCHGIRGALFERRDQPVIKIVCSSIVLLIEHVTVPIWEKENGQFLTDLPYSFNSVSADNSSPANKKPSLTLFLDSDIFK